MMEGNRLIAVVEGIEWCLTGCCSVQCDECRDLYRTRTFLFPRPEERAQLAEALQEDGWQVTGDHERHVCPTCVKLLVTG
jgi:heterodisulfide reductase subunit B